MNLRTKYKRYFRAACTTLLLLAFVGCAKDKLVEYGPGDATGKVVMVSLKVGIPPAVEPASTSGYSAAKSLFRDRNDSGLSFTVALEQRPSYTTFGLSNSMSTVPLREILIN